MLFNTSSVSPELLHGFARGLAPVAFSQNITLLSINQAFFHRFLSNTNKWICRILEFREKILEFRDNFLSLREKIDIL